MKKKHSKPCPTKEEIAALWLENLGERIAHTVSYGGDSFYIDSVYSDIKDYLGEIQSHLDISSFDLDWRP